MSCGLMFSVCSNSINKALTIVPANLWIKKPQTEEKEEIVKLGGKIRKKRRKIWKHEMLILQREFIALALCWLNGAFCINLSHILIVCKCGL